MPSFKSLLLSGSLLSIVFSVGATEEKSDNQSKPTVSSHTITVYGRQPDDTVNSVPQTINVFDSETFELTGADTLSDIIRLVPGASKTGSSLDMFNDDFLMRGFDAEQAVNGLGLARTAHPTDMVNVERIEVLKGPASILYGQMEPGGTINIVTKQAQAEFYSSGLLQVGQNKLVRGAADVTGALSSKVNGRLNMAYQEQESEVDFWNYNKAFVAPNISIDLTDTSSLIFEGAYSVNEWTAIPGGNPVSGTLKANPNGQIAESFNSSWKDGNTRRDSYSSNLRFIQEIKDDLLLRASYSYTKNDADWKEYVPFGLADDNRTLERLVFVGHDADSKDTDFILDLAGDIKLGEWSHKFVTGINFQNSDSVRPVKLYRVESIDLFEPRYRAMELLDSAKLRDRTLSGESEVKAFFVQDRITVNNAFHVLAGLRYTDSDQSQQLMNHLDDNSVNNEKLKQSDWTTQAGVIYDFTQQTSAYLSRSESFVPQQGTTSGKKNLEAEQATQIEMGIRHQFARMQLSAATYLIEKENIAIEDPLNSDFEVTTGKASSKGFDLSVLGYITQDWYLSAAYSYTDTEVKHTDDPEIEGNHFSNVPLNTATLQSRYYLDSVPGLSIGATVVYMDERPGDDESSFVLPDHTRLDIAGFYRINESLQFDVFVNNLLDEDVYSPGSFDGVIKESGRTVSVQLKYTD